MKSYGLSEILNLYTIGKFPMSEHRNSDGFAIIEPEKRGIIPLDALHISRSLAKYMRQGDFHYTINHSFSAVIEACTRPRPEHPETWISESLQLVYEHFNEAGFAHSLEVWDGPNPHKAKLQGGLYGIALGGAFFGESMFSHERNGSKMALVYLVRHLNERNFALLDTQYSTDHLETMGGIEITQDEYLKRLAPALEIKTSFVDVI